MATRVIARKKDVKGYVNAMRPAWLGNPFYPEEFEDIESCLKKYETYLRDKLKVDNAFAQRFDGLWGRTIGCSCPLDKPCHVDIIIKVLNERRKPKSKYATTKTFEGLT